MNHANHDDTQRRMQHNGHAGHGGHDKHAGHDPEMFRRKFWLSLILTIPVLIYSPSIQDWFGFTPPAFTGSDLIPFIFSVAIFFYGGLVFLQGAWHELRERTPGMMTLISLAIGVAFVYSVATELGFDGEPLYWELASLVTIMVLGHWIEMSAVQRAGSAIDELSKLLPDTAERISTNGDTEEVAVSDLREGDLVLVRPGGQVPVDGVIEEGESTLDEAMMTGESRPVSRAPGDAVIGGTVNGEGSLRIRVEHVGDDTALSGIMRIVDDAQRSRSRAQALADRAAYWLTIIAIVSGALTFVGWLLADESAAYAISRTVTVLVIACPHALGLAIPLVVAISTNLAAGNGLLVRNRVAMEQARDLNVVIFDKTGTLTRGELGVVDTLTTGGLGEQDALRMAAAVEADSEHPIARALTLAAQEGKLEPLRATRFEALSGRGVRAEVDGAQFHVGGPRLLEQLDLVPPEALGAAVEQWGGRGQSVIYLVRDEQVVAAFAIADVVREESRQAVDALTRAGVGVAMITGDSQDVARSVAQDLGIDEVFAEVLPEDKAGHVKQLQQDGRRVAMVGDGVNDAPALATADVGIAIGAGTDVAIESADIILVRDDPRDVASVVGLSKATYRKMLQNLGWATGYNVLAIPLAAGVLAPWGIVLAPAVGAVLMSFSTVIVALNAQLLRRARLGAGTPETLS